MSRINSTKGRHKTNISITSNSNKTHSDFSKREIIKKFSQDIPLIENFNPKENTDSGNMEQVLINFYEYSLDSYHKNLYDNLLKEIEINKNLLYTGTKESFKIFIIEIKCLMKLMVEKYENDLNDINDEQMSVKDYINKIQKEFLKINPYIKSDDSDEYETITQIYCKFLIYLIKFSQRKEEYFKSLAYITLGINMIKIYFIRKKVAKDIKLYKRYIYFLILLINHLLGEGNFTQALFYSESILKIIETALKILYNDNNNYNYNKNRKNKYLMEFIRCSGFVNIYIGLCHELIKSPETVAMEAYKQAFYFFIKLKSHNFYGIKINEEKIFYDNNFLKIGHYFLNRLKTKIDNEKKRKAKLRKSLILERFNAKIEENIEKKKKLKLISSGLNENQKKYNQIENKLFTTVLDSKNNKIMDKFDKILLTIAFPGNKNSQLRKQKKLSDNTMENMCHLQIYNKLLTEKYQEFIMTNNNIRLSCPKDEEDFIHKVNSYLTQNMEIKPQSFRKNQSIRIKSGKSNKNFNKNILSSPNILNTKSFRTPKSSTKLPKKNLSKITDLDSKNDNKIHRTIKSSKRLSFKKKFDFSDMKIDIPRLSSNIFKHQITKSVSDNCFTSETYNTKNNKIKPKPKLKPKKDPKLIWSKNIYLNPKFFRRYMKIDKLIKKELNFQKDILNLKGNNSKLYYNSFAKEIYTAGKDKEEERNQDYMILNEKIEQKVLNYKKEYEKLIYFNIKKKRGNNIKNNNKNNNDILDEEILDINKKLNIEGNDENEEEKNFNEINKQSLLKVNEKLRNIIYRIRTRKKILKRLKGESSS